MEYLPTSSKIILKIKKGVKMKTETKCNPWRQPAADTWRNPMTLRLPMSGLITIQLQIYPSCILSNVAKLPSHTSNNGRHLPFSLGSELGPGDKSARKMGKQFHYSCFWRRMILF